LKTEPGKYKKTIFLMTNLKFHYRWHFRLSSTPAELWPFLSDVNQFFKDIGGTPVREVPLQRNSPNKHKQLTSDLLHRPDAWVEEPFQWEAPCSYSVKRNYKRGIFNELTFSVDLTNLGNETQVAITHAGTAKNKISLFRIKSMFSNKFKRRIRKVLISYDLKVKTTDEYTLLFHNKVRHRKRWTGYVDKLSELSGKPAASRGLVDFLKYSDDLKLKKIVPGDIADFLNIDLSEALELLLSAASLKIVTFSWNLVCPDCRSDVQSSTHLAKITEPLYCNSCEKEFKLDFNKTIQIAFQPHPLVRKISDKIYAVAGPAFSPHIILQKHMERDKRQYLNVRLSPGKYRLYTDTSEGSVLIDVAENAQSNNLIRIRDGKLAGQKISLSSDSNLVLHNQTGKRILVSLEKADWLSTVTASEVTSLQIFRNYFPGEVIRGNEKFHASDLTVMFTDLYNSSEMYSTDGDESATKQVLDHFKILHDAVGKERGAIVKTIGDSVMAVFRSPIHALRAFLNAEEAINKASSSGKIKLKAGIHTGDCIAVTLNNRIDYFGKTVNISSRLVEKACENEVVVSNEVFTDSNFQAFLQRENRKLNILNLDTSLKGCENRMFELKRITSGKTLFPFAVNG